MANKKEIIINATFNEVRVAITENGKLAEFFIELPEKQRIIGNVYLGKVNKVAPGLNAAFVDIGFNQDAFLHFSDVDESLEQTVILDEDDDDEDEFEEKVGELNLRKPEEFEKKENADKSEIALRKQKPNSSKNDGSYAVFKTKRSGSIKINLEKGQDVIVQVVREAYANKGVKVTTRIGVPGRYVVLLPFDSLLGVSRKIGSYHERRRLRKIARQIIPKGSGCIIRTAAQGKSDEDLKKDWEELAEIWKAAEKEVKSAKEPQLIYRDMHLATSLVRDLFNSDFESVVVDSKKVYKEITSYLQSNSPALAEKVRLHQSKKPIFEAYGVENELASTYKRKLSLPGGGSIVIDQTEAMFVIDVNSGRSSEKYQEVNAYKTNMEAAREIARQIRLRDLSGMILIDFIDMTQDQNRKKLLNEMRRQFGRDRAKTVVYPLTQIGVMQITRQRTNLNITEKMSEVCPMCNGRGRVTSKFVLLNSIERWLKKFRSQSKEFRIVLKVHSHMANYLTEGTISRLAKLMIKYFVKIKIEQSDNIRIDDFHFISVKKQIDITNEYI